jgi:hypothetical protein
VFSKNPEHASRTIASIETKAIGYLVERAEIRRHRSLATFPLFLGINLALRTVVHSQVLTLATADRSLRNKSRILRV